ncbi:MAG: multiple sugar transport system substrate-binding protein [Candidatus Sumerlaeota bacterium]|nr:multiple sugar transport system substrate-binding protein [Candidatus Sumerlaeota bacterium]
MHRFLRLAVLAVLALFPLSCTAPGAPEGKILIEFWDYPRLPAVSEYLEEQIAEFEHLNPDVHVELTKLSWAKGGERLDIAAFAGRPPDIAGSTLTLKYVEAGLLEPLDSYLDEPIPGMDGKTWREDIHPSILNAVQWQGQTWAMPWYKEGFVILLNRDILEERGVEPPENGQWTWDEFLAAMRKLTFDRDGDGKIDVYGIGFSTGKEKWEAYSFLFAEGMQILDPTGRHMVIDSEATRRGIQRLLTMEYDEQVSLPGAGGIQDDTTWTAFSTRDRKLAATCQGLWAIKAVTIQNQRLEETRAARPDATDLPPPLRIAVALFPQMPGQPQIMASYGTGSYMIFKRPTDPARTEAAVRLARFLTLERGQEINREAGLLPCRISHLNVLADVPLYEDIVPLLPKAISPPTHPAWQQLDQVIGEQLQLVLLRAIDVDTAVTNMQVRGQMVLDDFWKSHDAAADQ